MYKIPQSIMYQAENATIGGGGRFEPLLGWRACRKSLGIGGLITACTVVQAPYKPDKLLYKPMAKSMGMGKFRPPKAPKKPLNRF